MSEHCQDMERCCADGLQGTLSIHTRKITDACRDKDCIEDLRVYLTTGSQAVLDTASSVKVRLLSTGTITVWMSHSIIAS